MHGAACVGLAGWITFGVGIAAHHSVLPYDNTQPTTITGTVTRLVWQNPHTYVYVDVDTGDRVEQWVIESEGASLLARLGWQKDTLAAGDRITSVGGRANNGATRMRCQTIETADGQRLRCFP